MLKCLRLDILCACNYGLPGCFRTLLLVASFSLLEQCICHAFLSPLTVRSVKTPEMECSAHSIRKVHAHRRVESAISAVVGVEDFCFIAAQ